MVYVFPYTFSYLPKRNDTIQAHNWGKILYSFPDLTYCNHLQLMTKLHKHVCTLDKIATSNLLQYFAWVQVKLFPL